MHASTVDDRDFEPDNLPCVDCLLPEPCDGPIELDVGAQELEFSTKHYRWIFVSVHNGEPGRHEVLPDDVYGPQNILALPQPRNRQRIRHRTRILSALIRRRMCPHCRT